ncbi:selenoprotein H-like [Zingiber officinale]|uniref:Selenoprotein H n=1 Tax=Zingiber officinale TaxID=94328 RepID=A0A8J5I2B2_ZINOF|nr:selenoprotein H-like [Zingiber officinale]KAG6527001.1 hypothetical protein ZIOFF_009088 [Zingiber officinale]
MAPKRKTRAAAKTPALSLRKTRSATAGKRADPPPPKKSKQSSNGKAKGARGGKRKVKDVTVIEISDAEEAPASPASKDKAAAVSSKTIIVEACKQCNSFKVRAMQVKEGLENAVPGIIVSINPDKPRRGCFEIREGGCQTFVSLLDMRRPFTRMKELNIEDVIKDIVKKIT